MIHTTGFDRPNASAVDPNRFGVAALSFAVRLVDFGDAEGGETTGSRSIQPDENDRVGVGGG
ncbi:hypothetical protein, partial [Haloterrigena salifodinae]|uniref:hypothetical protein n=1 Tax=Haloterrigena salifodinae TaxID=2675099 RepID=UPI001B8735A4